MNQLELTIVLLLLKNHNYIKYNDYVDIKYIKEYYKEIYYIYLVVKELQDVNNKDITLDELIAFFFVKYPDAKNNAVYEGLFNQAKDIDVTNAVGENILAAIKQRQVALLLSEKSLAYTQGFATLQEVSDLAMALEAPETGLGADETEYVTTDLDELLNSVVRVPGLRWRLQCLNKSMGSLRQGDFGFIFARPETGKTTFLASEISFMLDQTEHPILWFNC